MRFLEKNFALILFGCLLAGLFVPQLSIVPTLFVPISLAIVIFLSCSKINLAELKEFSWLELGGFYLLRYVILPPLLFFGAKALFPDVANAILLLLTLPAAIAIPVLAGVMRGNVSLSISMVFLSSALAPFVIPGYFFIFARESIAVDALGLFITTASMILLPMALYFGTIRQSAKLHEFVKVRATSASALLLGAGIAVVVAKYRDVLLESPQLSIEFILITAIVLHVLATIGWFFPFFRSVTPALKRTQFLLSWSINLSLGISLALLYLTEVEVAFMVIANFVSIAVASIAVRIFPPLKS